MTIRSWIRKLLARKPRPLSSRPRLRWRTRLTLEVLEDRLAPATITVLTNGDATGVLTPVSAGVYTAPTLRAAIDGANSLGGSETIQFAAGVFGQTITAALNDTTNPFAFGPTAFVIAAGDNLTI